MSCGVICRRGLDPELLWYRPEAVAQIQPLAWEPSYAVRAALKRQKRPKKPKTKKKTQKPKKTQDVEILEEKMHATAYTSDCSVNVKRLWGKNKTQGSRAGNSPI